jgi:hypothetical protein
MKKRVKISKNLQEKAGMMGKKRAKKQGSL